MSGKKDSDSSADGVLWRATFLEFKQQALRTLQSNVFDTASGGWVDVGLAAAASGDLANTDWSDLWPQQQWQIAFEILLCQTPAAIKNLIPGHDDLLFFVYWADIASAKGSRVFARRNKGHSLPEDMKWSGGGSSSSSSSNDNSTPSLAAHIDWRSSLLLNIVLQTQYVLTVMRCPPWEVDQLLDSCRHLRHPIQQRQEEEQSTRSIRISKIVHASPSTTPINLDQTKSSDSAPTLSYPEICFAVNDFVEAFGCLTLSDSTDCYCVLLHADVATSWKRAVLENHDDQDEDGGLAAEVAEKLVFSEKKTTSTTTAAHDAMDKNLQTHGVVVVFNGYVSCRQLATVVRPQLESPLRVLQVAARRHSSSSHNPHNHTSRVLMRGPGGVGRADVAVTATKLNTTTTTRDDDGVEVVDEEKSSSTPKMLKMVQSVFKGVVEAAKVVGNGGSGPLEDVQLVCAIMSLQVPVDALAEEILQGIC